MRFGAHYVLVVCGIAMLVTPVGAQGPNTTITGAPPFTLGMPLLAALGANRTLGLTTAPCPTSIETVNAVPTAVYATRMAAPLGGYPYIASVLLCFDRGTLVAIHVEWSADNFRDSSVEWQVRAQWLARQLTAAYAPALIRRNNVDESVGGAAELRDAQGNVLTMVADGPGAGFDIMLDYVAAAYAHALAGTATLTGSY